MAARSARRGRSCAQPWPRTPKLQGLRPAPGTRSPRRRRQRARALPRRSIDAGAAAPGSTADLFEHRPHARARCAEELPKPNASGCASSATPTSTRCKLELCSPTSRSTTTSRASSWPTALTFLAEMLGDDDPLVAAGPRPASRRASAPTSWSRAPSSGTSGVRKQLWRGRQARPSTASERPDDRARAELVDAEARALRKRFETRSTSVKRQAYAQIAKAKFAIEGDERLPGRDLHAAAGLRHRQGLRARTARRSRRSPTFAGLYERSRGARQQAAVRPAARAGSSARTSST